jgi:cytochrome c biogenesis protein CcdA
MTFIFALLAGVLSTLSPCVLPILPIIVSSALQSKVKGLIALVMGLSLSFAIMGTFISYAAMLWGFDTDLIKNVGAAMVLFFGLVMVIDKWNQKFVEITSRFTDKGNNKIATFEANGAKGQFLLGILLGVVWVPCVGPTLGSAIGLAVSGDGFLSAFVTMLIFGIGAGIPLLLIGLFSSRFSNRDALRTGSAKAKKILGYMLILIAVLVLTGADKQVEIFLLSITPDWLNDLTTRF